MRTEDLIARLARDPAPAPPVARTVLAAWPLAVLASLAALLLGWGLRSDLLAALGEPVVLAKVALPGAVAAAALWGGLRLARPEGRARPPFLGLVLAALAALALVAVGLGATPRAEWEAALRGETLSACLLSIPALGVPPALALLLALRRGASTRPALSGALAGLAAGGAAAAIYALHCPEDHPLFFVTWYGTGILVLAAAGALLGWRWLRW